MVVSRIVSMALCLVFLGAFANAGYGLTLTCEITKGASEEWRIPERITFKINSDRLTARVIDPISRGIGQDRVFAEIREDSEAKLVMAWRVNGFPKTASITRGAAIKNETRYRAVYYRKLGRFSLLADSVGWQPGETGRGNCTWN